MDFAPFFFLMLSKQFMRPACRLYRKAVEKRAFGDFKQSSLRSFGQYDGR
jgi:hypothetical protein